MANLKFDKEITALLVIDPYNDFISEGGKVWDQALSANPAAFQAIMSPRLPRGM